MAQRNKQTEAGTGATSSPSRTAPKVYRSMTQVRREFYPKADRARERATPGNPNRLVDGDLPARW